MKKKCISHWTLNLGFLSLLTFASFLPALQAGFVNWDDPAYITQNPLLTDLNVSTVKTLFKAYVNSNYHPLTILSFNIEYHFFKLEPFFYHFNNLLLHVMNVCLVYAFIYLLCANPLTSLLTAILFSVHPLRVESVVWVTERKDVLFVFFYMLGLLFYILRQKQALKPWVGLGLVWMCFLLSLLAKPAAVSFPLVICLIDYYRGRKLSFKWALCKSPFFVVSCLFGMLAVLGTLTPYNYDIVTLEGLAKRTSHNLFLPAEVTFEAAQLHPHYHPFFLKTYALFLYFQKLFWVFPLSAYHPYPLLEDTRELGVYYASGVFLLFVVWIIWKNFHKNRTFVFGLLFFLCTIVFNLPNLRVAHSFIGERFTYLPYLGLFFMISTGFQKCWESVSLSQYKVRSKTLLALAVFIIINCALITFRYCQSWRNSETLWTNVIRQYPYVDFAYFNRGNYLFRQHRFEEALEDFTSTLSLNPEYYEAYVNRARVYAFLGDTIQELKDYNRAIGMQPTYRTAYLYRADLYLSQKQYSKALADCNTLLKMYPQDKKAQELKNIAVANLP